MKLQIIEIGFTDIINGYNSYLYLLELDRKLLALVETSNKKYNPDEAYRLLLLVFLDNIKPDIGFYNKNHKMPIIETNVILEQEVSDHYLKDLITQQRINELEKDFIWWPTKIDMN